MRIDTLFTLRSLIVTGFIIAVIPLSLAVLYAAVAMRESAALGKTLNYEVFEQTKSIRLVLQKASDIERKARLFVLLADPAVRQPYERQSYETARAAFKQALAGLLKLRVDNKIILLANELAEKENLIYQQIIGAETANAPSLPVDEAFQGLREASNTLSREFENHVERQFNALRQQSESLEQGLLTKGAGLLLASILFIAILLAVLSRSMRQLDTAIRKLGTGKLADAIRVNGPADLRYLGERLEWLRTRLLNLETSKQQFMRNLAREIETPLEGIREGALQLAEGADGEFDAARQDSILRLGNNIEKLQTVSEELLRHSQIQAHPEDGEKTTVNVKEVLERLVEEYQDRLQAKSITVKALARPVELSGIHSQLRAIIGQLLDNAVKYSPVGGEIRIMLRTAGNQLELEVEDEGPGIGPDERGQVFAPFFRGKANKTSDTEGSGMGLAIVGEYVANHQGKVESVEPRLGQHGARIRVQIPLTDDM